GAGHGLAAALTSAIDPGAMRTADQDVSDDATYRLCGRARLSPAEHAVSDVDLARPRSRTPVPDRGRQRPRSAGLRSLVVRVRTTTPVPAEAAAAGRANHRTAPGRPGAGRPAGRSPPGWVGGAATAAAARSAEL